MANNKRTKRCLRCNRKFTPRRACRFKATKYCSRKCFITPFLERFWKYVYKTDHCWFWIGLIGKDRNKYGKIRDSDGIKIKAHHVSYKLHNGPIPKGKIICHTCDNPSCVRPDHLVIGTWKSNAQDMVKRGRHFAARGEDQNRATLTRKKVLEIRKKYANGINQPELGRQYNVTQSCISAVILRITWKHV